MGKFCDLTVEEKERLLEDLRREIAQAVEQRYKKDDLTDWETDFLTDRDALPQIVNRRFR